METFATKDALHATEKALSELAERRRNEAIGVFAAFALLLSILGYFGLQQIARTQIEAFVQSEIVEKAIAARDEAERAAAHLASLRSEGDRILADLRDHGGLPPGTIISWLPPSRDRPLADQLPAGWAICDGQNGTPDLRLRFVLGSSDISAIGSQGGSSKHSHVASFSGSRFEATNQGRGGTGATRHDDNRISIGETDTLPPHVLLAFIMRTP